MYHTLCHNVSTRRDVSTPSSTRLDDATTTRRRAMAKKTVKAGMNTSRDGLVDMGTVPGTVKTLVRRMHETANRGIAVGVGDAEGNDADSTRD